MNCPIGDPSPFEADLAAASAAIPDAANQQNIADVATAARPAVVALGATLACAGTGHLTRIDASLTSLTAVVDCDDACVF